METTADRTILDIRVALLTNYLNPHRLHLVEQVAPSVRKLRVFLSGTEDKMHGFMPSWNLLDVTIERSLRWTSRFRNVHGYEDASEIHLPYNVLFEMRSFRPDLILSAELGVRTIQAVLYKMLFPHTKLIAWTALSEHTEATRGWFRRILRKWIVKHIDGIFVNGKSGEKYMRKLGFDGPSFSIPYAIDREPFLSDCYDPGSKKRRLLYAGQLIPRKGVTAFCRVLNRWCADHSDVEVEFTIIGQGPEQNSIQSVRTVPNLSIILMPLLKQENLAEHYHRADLYALPTFGDEWGVVVNEAMSAGLPVIGSVYSQAVTELIEDGHNGWTFSPYDPSSIYRAINCALTTDANTLKIMSDHAKATIADITPANIAERVLDGITQVAGAGTPEACGSGVVESVHGST
jgi:glycosyltransferase involved in cell wall biosynthesis